MHSRWYNITVIVLWLSAMTWLIATKVAPSFWFGEPPNSASILNAQKTSPVVGWWVAWCEGEHEKPLGWALVETQPIPQDLVRINSLIQLHLPLSSLVPPSLRAWLGGLPLPDTKVLIESHSEMDFDPFGRLSRFESGVRQLSAGEVTKLQEPSGSSAPTPVYVAARKVDDLVKLRGAVDGDVLSLSVSTPNMLPFDIRAAAPGAAVVKDPLSPQVALPGLRLGQRWTTEVYDPMEYLSRRGADCREILHACVEREAVISWDDRSVHAMVVVFRSDPGATHDDDNVRGKLWVAPDGGVLRQQVAMLGKTFVFVRMSDRQAKALAAAWQKPNNPAWSGGMPGSAAARPAPYR